MNGRPHPGLFHHEKEHRWPVAGDADAPGCRVAFLTNDRAAAPTRGTSRPSRDLQHFSPCPEERVRVRASVKAILCFPLLFCLAFVSPLLAQNTITSIMSPIAGYQYAE